MPKTVEYYLSKGFDQKTAEYFAKGRRKVVDVAAHDDFTLTIRFDNGECRLYDVRPLIQKGTVLESFSNLADFRRVYVDEQHAIAWDIDPTIDSNKVWNNKVDISSDSCYLDSVPIGGARNV